jgi:hypothetical protein
VKTITITITIAVRRFFAVRKIFLFARDVGRIVDADNVHAMLWSEAGAHDMGNGSGDNPVQA